eukprot:SAG22_NODE_8686_length_637_cov_0.765799_1_plen_46_part_00
MQTKPLHEDNIAPLALLISLLAAKTVSASSPVSKEDWERVQQLVS